MKEGGGKRPIWAPWRIEYIRSEKDGGCFICAAAAAPESDDASNLLVLRGETCLVVMNRYPYNPGHLLVSPYRHVADIADLTADERLETMDLLAEAKRILSETMSPDGFNIGFNLGLVAGAGLEDHIHAHIVPRWNGDTNFMPVLDGSRVVPEALDATWEMLVDAWTRRG